MVPTQAAHHHRAAVAPARQQRKSWPKPKNGSYMVILLAGGPADRARELRNAFAEKRGALVKYHLDYDRVREFQRAIPPDVDLVIVVKTMIGHPAHSLVIASCRKAGVPIVRTTHKWTNINTTLHYHFGPLPGAVRPLPLNITSVAYLRNPEGDPQPEVKPAPEAARVVQQIAQAVNPEIERAERDLRRARLDMARKDTVTLIRELQARLAQIGPEASCLIDQREVTFYTGKPPPVAHGETPPAPPLALVPPTLPPSDPGPEGH
jgi:hypothetical protein